MRRAAPASDRARLDEEDERRAAEPGQQRELRGSRVPEWADEHEIDNHRYDERGERLREAQQDLVDEVTHRASDRPPTLEGPDDRHLVGVLEIASDRYSACD